NANTRTAPPANTPLTATVPEDIARICGIPEGHLNAFAAALSDTYEWNSRAGATIDMVLQKMYYTIASLALRATTIPAPTATAAPAANAPATYAAALASQTTPLPQQTGADKTHHGNKNTRATKPPSREEVILHTSRMTSLPTDEIIINAVKAASKGRTPPIGVRRLPSGDSAVVFPGGTDRWYTDPPPRYGSLCLTVATNNDAALLIKDGVTLGSATAAKPGAIRPVAAGSPLVVRTAEEHTKA
ncbi:hypothetical protein SEUCBS139899_010126, partial [Sporothrix eucalyptigena]